MSRLKRGFSRRQSTYPMPHPSDRRRQDFDFAGYRDRPIEPDADPTVKRFVWRVLIESSVILGLLVGVVFLTYQAGYLLLFKGSEEASTAATNPQGTAPSGVAQDGSPGTRRACSTPKRTNNAHKISISCAARNSVHSGVRGAAALTANAAV